MKNTPTDDLTQEAFDRQAAENRTDLKGARLARFLAEAHGLRRNLALRKRQTLQRKDKKCMRSK
ncbi:MAG: hypothetical protein ACI4QM_02225 [Alphaproteobacteria bacterium]